MPPFIMLAHSFFDHPLWVEERAFSRAEAWLDLIREAAWRPHKRLIAGNVIEIPRAGIVASVRFLAGRWKWSKTKVCLFLELLQKEGMIRTEKGQGITLILLCNFDRYNAPEGQQQGQRKDSERTAKGQRKDEREEGKEEEDVPPNPRKRGDGEKSSANLPTTDEAKALADIFRRRHSTAWSEKEVRAFRLAKPTMADIELVAERQRIEEAKGDEGRHRRDLLTLLNNWPGEVDRARAVKVNGKHHGDEYRLFAT